MVWIMVDVEADGPCPGIYSMTELGAVVVEEGTPRTFYGQLAPISNVYKPEALAVSKKTRDEVLNFPHALETMAAFDKWISSVVPAGERPMFISDNNGFDWMFVCYYFHAFLDRNPFGHSSTNLGSLYKGLVKDTRKNFKHMRKTKHTHHPVDDAMGNVEAFLEILRMMKEGKND